MSIPTRADIQKRVASLIDGKKISRQAIEEMALDIARSAYRAGRRDKIKGSSPVFHGLWIK